MGMPVGISNSSYDAVQSSSPNINPNHSNFIILKSEQRDRFLILKVNYPNCNNYEGNKILVYQSTLPQIIDQGTIDPHFSDNPNFISPIARFIPTRDGWNMAKSFIHYNLKDENRS